MSLRALIHGFIPLSVLLLLASPYQVAAQTPSPDLRRGPYGHARVTPSMAIIIVVLIAALFFMVLFSIYIRHCSDYSGATARAILRGPNGLSSRLAAAHGLDAAVIETFPTLVYSTVKGLKIGKGALECAVCLHEFEDDETLRLISKCDHVFHTECIDEWLSSHTTCPVCRANLTPEPGDSVPQLSELHPQLCNLEAQDSAVEAGRVESSGNEERNVDVAAPEPEVIIVNRTLNRNLTLGSRSGRTRRFPRSHSTGHSLVHLGENTERYTLRLPAEVRNQVMNRELNRTMSMMVLPREGSTRRGYRSGGEEGSRGKHFNYRRLERLDQGAKSERWVFSRTPSFLARASALLTRATSMRSPKMANDRVGGSTGSVGQGEPGLPPV